VADKLESENSRLAGDRKLVCNLTFSGT
jgi:hypothetical protein